MEVLIKLLSFLVPLIIFKINLMISEISLKAWRVCSLKINQLTKPILYASSLFDFINLSGKAFLGLCEIAWFSCYSLNKKHVRFFPLSRPFIKHDVGRLCVWRKLQNFHSVVKFLNSYQGTVDFLLGIKDLFVLKWKLMGKTEPWKPQRSVL